MTLLMMRVVMSQKNLFPSFQFDNSLFFSDSSHKEGFDVPKICSTAALNYVEVAKAITEIYSTGMPQAVELIRLNLDKDRKQKKMLSESEINVFRNYAEKGEFIDIVVGG